MWKIEKMMERLHIYFNKSKNCYLNSFLLLNGNYIHCRNINCGRVRFHNIPCRNICHLTFSFHGFYHRRIRNQ